MTGPVTGFKAPMSDRAKQYIADKKKEKKMTHEEIEQALDQPGFALDTLSKSERSLLVDTVYGLVRDAAQPDETCLDSMQALEIWDAALTHAAMYVASHCVSGEEHAEAIMSFPKPKVSAPAPSEVPAGYVLVPLHPTPAMKRAGAQVNNQGQDFAHHTWATMLAWAPTVSDAKVEEFIATAPTTAPSDDAEHFIAEAIDRAPEPLRRLGEYLSTVLDEDRWKTAERMLLGACEAAPAPSERQPDAWDAALDAALDKVTDIDTSCDASAAAIEKAADAIRLLRR